MNELRNFKKLLEIHKKEGVVSNLLFLIDEMNKEQINILFDEIIKDDKGINIFNVFYVKKYFTKKQITKAIKNAIKCKEGLCLIKYCFKFLNDKQRKIAFLQAFKEIIKNDEYNELIKNNEYNSNNFINIKPILTKTNYKFVTKIFEKILKKEKKDE